MKHIIGFVLLVAGWMWLSHFVQFDIISWKFAGLFGMVMCFYLSSSFLGSARKNEWPWDSYR